jgi:hypothetical protein
MRSICIRSSALDIGYVRWIYTAEAADEAEEENVKKAEKKKKREEAGIRTIDLYTCWLHAQMIGRFGRQQTANSAESRASRQVKECQSMFLKFGYIMSNGNGERTNQTTLILSRVYLNQNFE